MKEIAFRWIDKYLINVTLKENFLFLFFAPVFMMAIVSATLIDAAEQQQEALMASNLETMSRLIEVSELNYQDISRELAGSGIQLLPSMAGQGVVIGNTRMQLTAIEAPNYLSGLDWVHISIMLASCSFIAMCLYYIMTFIGGALYNIYEGLSKLADGDLSFRIGHAPARNDFNLIARTVDRVAEREKQFFLATRQAISLIKEISNDLQQLGVENQNLSSNQQQRIDSLASATEEMAGSIMEVANHAKDTSSETSIATEATTQGQSNVDLTRQSIVQLGSEINTAAQAVAKLDHNAAEIDDVVTTINAISEQTNLLALNAAIEAARAGDKGRGFAVVADEVRTLAGRTQMATVEIKKMIEALQNNSQSLMKVMNNTVENAGSCESLMESVSSDITDISAQNLHIADRSIEIAAASEQQGVVAQSLAADVETVREQSLAFSTMVSRSTEEVKQLNHQADVLDSLMKDLKV
ncbi:methyl-accepting chemotaxis protein [Vibrio sp. FNV 38]|nr:methyl-accepting chemotaxis protein [Vibrio sp. FNV 38]